MRIILLISSLAFLISCNNNNSSDDVSNDDTVYLKTDTIASSIEAPVKINNLIWSAVYDSIKRGVVLKQQREVNPDTLTAEKIIKDINTKA